MELVDALGGLNSSIYQGRAANPHAVRSMRWVPMQLSHSCSYAGAPRAYAQIAALGFVIRQRDNAEVGSSKQHARAISSGRAPAMSACCRASKVSNRGAKQASIRPVGLRDGGARKEP